MAEKNENTDAQLEDVDEGSSKPKNSGRVRSAMGKTDESGRKAKGRGFQQDDREADDRYSGKASEFDTLDDSGKAGPIRSVEGWIVFATGIHEEASEDQVHDAFSEFGEVRSLHLPLDRRTGFVKGYALIEYGSRKEAQEAISELNDTKFTHFTHATPP